MLYTLIQINKITNNRAIVYGHVTENVLHEHMTAYIDDDHYVIVERYKPRTDIN